VVKVGDDIEVKVLRVDTDERKIGLSRKRLDWSEEESAAAPDESAATPAKQPKKSDEELKGGVGQAGPLFGTPDKA
jgi:small subunit ribosomal protein S1